MLLTYLVSLLVPQRAFLGALDLLYLGVTIENMCRRHLRAPWPPLLVHGNFISRFLERFHSMLFWVLLICYNYQYMEKLFQDLLRDSTACFFGCSRSVIPGCNNRKLCRRHYRAPGHHYQSFFCLVFF